MIKQDAKTIDIKEGDPLIYYKFNTTEKIKLIEFDDQELQRPMKKVPEWMCSTLKDHTDKVLTLEKCYAYSTIQNETKNIKTNKKEYNIMGSHPDSNSNNNYNNNLDEKILYWVPNSMKELWVEKYRPKTIADYVFRDDQRNVSKLNNG